MPVPGTGAPDHRELVGRLLRKPHLYFLTVILKNTADRRAHVHTPGRAGWGTTHVYWLLHSSTGAGCGVYTP